MLIKNSSFIPIHIGIMNNVIILILVQKSINSQNRIISCNQISYYNFMILWNQITYQNFIISQKFLLERKPWS